MGYVYSPPNVWSKNASVYPYDKEYSEPKITLALINLKAIHSVNKAF